MVLVAVDQEILPFLSQVREILMLTFRTRSLVRFPVRATVPPKEIKTDKEIHTPAFGADSGHCSGCTCDGTKQ